MKRTKIAFLIVAAAIAAYALAEETFTLKRVAKVGDEQTYNMKVEADFGGQMIEFTAVSIDKVVKVEDNGTIHISSSQKDGKIKVAEQEMEMPEDEAVVTQYGPLGDVLKIDGPSDDPGTYRISNMSVIRTPDAPVKVGDKWSYTFKADSKTGAVAAKADYELVGTEKVGSYDTVKVKISFKETEGDEPASAESTAWLDVKDFAIVKITSVVKKAPLPDAPEPVDLTVTMERK